MPVALGLHHPRLAAVRAAVKEPPRRPGDLFLIEGAGLVAEALAAGILPDELYAVPASEAHPVVTAAEARGIPVFVIPERAMRRLSDLESPPGLLAIARVPPRDLSSLLQAAGTVIATADLNDPGNLGTLLRAAEALGARGFVASDRGVALFHPKVVRAAAGASFRLPALTAAPDELASAAGTRGWTILGLDPRGEPIDRLAEPPPRAIVVVGHERHGLGRFASLCERLVAIPMPGPTESLNAAIAGALALYELGRRPAGGA